MDRREVSGWQGGKVATTGIVLQYDTRDNVYNSSKGIWVEGKWMTSSNFVGSEYSFDKYRLEFRGFSSIGSKHVIGVNALLLHGTGNLPFTHMAMIGGNRRMRGYYEGRFRDNNMLQAQVEYRVNVWRRFGAVAFLATGKVSPELQDLRDQAAHYSGGLGLRYMLDVEKKINIRLDYAQGEGGSSGWYVTFGEAF
ncbi:MAG: BamA/TamA family outer membrane protein [Flavobacteriales bacterium]|nr:BamA/TamA family outer membrane protein [Flavobacteriales bacterium]